MRGLSRGMAGLIRLRGAFLESKINGDSNGSRDLGDRFATSLAGRFSMSANVSCLQ